METVKSEFKTGLCKRCRCQFLYEPVFKGKRMSWRALCDPCAPLQKAEHQKAHAARLKEMMRTNRSGMGGGRDPFQNITVRSYASVARSLGCSLESVRATEASALAKCRRLFTYQQLCVLLNNG